MAYIPVALTPRVCVHCHTTYYAKHKRRIYCSSSCNTLAWMARQPQEQTLEDSLGYLTVPAKTELAFSAQNLTTVATATALTTLANYMLNDRPAQQKIMAMIKRIEDSQLRLEKSPTAINKILLYLVDYVNTQIAEDYTLPGRMEAAKLAREQRRDALKQGSKASLKIGK